MAGLGMTRQAKTLLFAATATILVGLALWFGASYRDAQIRRSEKEHADAWVDLRTIYTALLVLSGIGDGRLPAYSSKHRAATLVEAVRTKLSSVDQSLLNKLRRASSRRWEYIIPTNVAGRTWDEMNETDFVVLCRPWDGSPPPYHGITKAGVIR